MLTTRVADVSSIEADTLFVPGAGRESLRAVIRDVRVRSWTVAAARRARRCCSACTGAFVLAAWGLLDGRRAATHWQAAEELARRHPKVDVDAEALFVEDAPLWTSAGVSTGIDMALALVERDLGRAVATGVARRLVLQSRRPGRQSQFSALLEAQAGPYAALADWIGENLDEGLRLETLAARAGQALRTFIGGSPRAALGKTPAAFVERLRLDRARTLLEAGESAKQVAALTGLGSLDRLGPRSAVRSGSALRIIARCMSNETPRTAGGSEDSS